MRPHGSRRTMKIILAAAALVALAALFPHRADALGTPAGTILLNQATASYQDAAANNFTTLSNTTTITVDPVYSVAISSPADLAAPSGSAAYYPYTLTNTGNATNTFALGGTLGPLGWAATFYADDGTGPGGIANDGVHQVGELTVVASTGALGADATYRFFMAVAVPGNTANGTTEVTTLSVNGANGGAADDATDPVMTTAQAPALLVAKAVRNMPAGAFGAAATAPPGGTLQYQITATNNGAVAATSVTLSDPINGNTGFLVGSASFDAGTTTLVMVTEYSNDSGTTWAYNPASTGCGAPAGLDDCVTNIRWRSTGGGMNPGGSSFSTLFQVTVK